MVERGTVAERTSAPIWTAPYASLVAAVFLSYVNQVTLLPVIPLHVRALGGSEWMSGIVLAAFSLASFALRPRIGRLVDDWDARWVMLLGCLLLAATTAGCLVPVMGVLLAANVLRGVGWAAVNTGSHVLLARLAPPSRRAEASGYFSFFQGAAGAVGPVLALAWLAAGGSAALIFGLCAVCAALSFTLGRPLLKSAGLRPLASDSRQRGERRPVIARSAALPSVLVMAVMATQPAVLSFVPLYAQRISVSSDVVTVFFVLSGIASLAGRSLLGRLADVLGPGVVVLCGFVLMGGSMVALLVTTQVWALLAVSVAYSVGQGMALPALTALAIERAEPERVGVAMATYSAAFQVGLGAGGLLSGVIISLIGYRGLYRRDGRRRGAGRSPCVRPLVAPATAGTGPACERSAHLRMSEEARSRRASCRCAGAGQPPVSAWTGVVGGTGEIVLDSVITVLPVDDLCACQRCASSRQ